MFSLNGKTYEVSYTYGVSEAKSRKGIVSRRATIAELKVFEGTENGKKVWSSTGLFGISECSENDKFCKLTGRKVALTRLVSVMRGDGIILSKKDSRVVWADFFSAQWFNPVTHEYRDADYGEM